MVTIKDVARVAGVSTSTVSRVIRKQGKVGAACRAKVQKVIDELGYRPNINAQALVSKKSNALGIIIPQVSEPFFGALAAGAEKITAETNYRVLISNTGGTAESELEALESLLQHRCGAIVFHSTHCSDEQLAKLAKQNPGLVFINRLVTAVPERCVWLDNNMGTQEMVRHLIEEGHSKFAVVTRSENNPDSRTRLDGIRSALMNSNLHLDNEMITKGKTADLESGREATVKLLDSGKEFDCIVAYNDIMAIGAIHELYSRGIRVPEDVSVVGFDDLLISITCFPQLTTVHYPVGEMAHYAAKLAINLSEESKQEGRTHLFMPHLVKRSSVLKRTS